MGFLVVLLIIASLLIPRHVNSDVDQLICDGVVVYNRYYEKQMLFGTLQEPRNLVMHSPSGELFFTHLLYKNKNIVSEIRVCNVDLKKCTDITSVKDGRAIAYDRTNGDVFLGGSNGIYKYHFPTRTAYFVAERNQKIYDMYIQESFYYIDTPTKQLYSNHTGKFQNFPLKEDTEMELFFSSTRRELYFANQTGLFKAVTPEADIYVLDDLAEVRQISQDYYQPSSIIYFGAKDGIYIQDWRLQKLMKIASIDDVFGITFRNISFENVNRSELLFSDLDAIYTLRRSSHEYTCLKKIAAERPEARSIKLEMFFDIY